MRQGLVLSVSCLMVACTSAPTTQYHSLQSSVPATIVYAHAPASVGVGPIKLPSMLDREGVVIRKASHTLSVSDTHLWAGQLEDEILQTLSAQLQMRLPTSRVQMVPWENSQNPTQQIAVTITQFDGAPLGNTLLSGQWQIQHPTTGAIVRTVPFQFSCVNKDNRIETVVANQALLLSQLADAIAEQLGSF